MYYIMNHTDHIIAADRELLDLLSLTSMDDLQKNIALGNLTFTSILDSVLEITFNGETETYNSAKHYLTGIMGDVTLVEVKVEQERPEVNIADTESSFELETPSEESEEEPEAEEEIFSLLEELEEDETEIPLPVSETTEEGLHPETPEAEPEMEAMEADELFDFLEEPVTLQNDAASASETEEESHAAISDYHDDTPIKIDSQAISKEIGISVEDYERFLKEYIETAFTLEEDLKSSKEHAKRHAVTTLYHLSHVLHLPMITEQIKNVQASSPEEEAESIKALYNTFARLDTSKEEEETLSVDTNEESSESSYSEGFGDIDLSDVTPIHFDFQPEACAEELSLPVELIEEFISDFIDLAHLETAKMLEAYRRGDLPTIQKIGHLLKGTSSNLRITPLSDTLYNIQFCENSDELEELIKIYWGHFLSFENQFNLKMQRN